MAIASLWAQLGLDTAGFKAGLNQAGILSQQFGKKVSNDMRNAFFNSLSPKKWFAEVSSAASASMAQVGAATSAAGGLPAAMGDIPLDDLTRLQVVADKINGSLEDMVALWQSNTSVAKEFRQAVKELRPFAPSGATADLGRGVEAAKTLGGDLSLKWLDYATDQYPALRIIKKALRVWGRASRGSETRAQRALALASGPKFGPGSDEGESEWRLFQFNEEQEQQKRIHKFQLMVAQERVKRTESGISAFSLGRPDQGSLAAIGGFSSAAGVLARIEARNQTDLLKLIAENTKAMADLQAMEAAQASL